MTILNRLARHLPFSRQLLTVSCGLGLLAFAPAASRAQSGSLDTSFNVGTGFNTGTNCVVVDQNGQILVGGGFTKYNGATVAGIARLNADGSLDTSFKTGSGLSSGSGSANVNAIALQADGKVIVGGAFTTVNGLHLPNLARLNSDGSVDTSFKPGVGPRGVVRAIALDAQGRIYVGGTFPSFNRVKVGSLVRLDTAGNIDSGFSYPVRTSNLDTILAISPQADGSVYIAGILFSVSNNAVARLNSDGSADGGFQTTVLANSASALAVQPDGKVIVGFNGQQSPDYGISNAKILRFNPNGSEDTTFMARAVPPVGDVIVTALALQSDGKILVGGLSTFGEYPPLVPGINRLNADGTLDTGFNAGYGTNSTVTSIAFQSGTTIVIGGAFTQVNNTSNGGIARLNDGPDIPPPLPVVTASPGMSNENTQGGRSTIILSLDVKQTGDVVVNYNLGGQAPNDNSAYATHSTTAVIKAGSTSKKVRFVPVSSGGASFKIKLRLLPGSGYTVGSADRAKIRIFENK